VDFRLRAVLLALLTLSWPSFAAEKKKPLTKEQKEFAKRCSPVLQGKWHALSLKSIPPQSGYKRAPAVSFIIQEDGTVTDVKLIRRSGSSKVDKDVVEQTALNRYNRRPGCPQLAMTTYMNIDFQ
jgi:hypothetical protein